MKIRTTRLMAKASFSQRHQAQQLFLHAHAAGEFLNRPRGFTSFATDRRRLAHTMTSPANRTLPPRRRRLHCGLRHGGTA
jgi:hypothetical protein